MATTRTADQLLADLAELETTQVFEHPAHPTHPMLPGGVYRLVEKEIITIYYNGKTMLVHYQEESFGYQQRVDGYGYQRGDNYSNTRDLELKPTAAVKRQLAKFVGSVFESVAEFKAVLFDEPILDEPGVDVLSAAGILDALTKNNMYTSGKYQHEPNGVVMGGCKIVVRADEIVYSKGVLKIKKAYQQKFEDGGWGEGLPMGENEDDAYEQVVLIPSAQVRSILREAGMVGKCSWHYNTVKNFTKILAPQAQIDKLSALVHEA